MSSILTHTNDLYLHADGDSFFVACELTLQPELRGRPVIVGEDRGIAVAMSMEAKKLGVTRGMPTFQIKKLYPEVVILSHHFDLYHEISEKMHQILSSYADRVEQYSIDECFARVRPAEIKYFGGEEKFIAELKNEIEKTLGVTYSFGLARTKALAKLASKLEKPNGSVILLSSVDEIRALEATPIDDIWGIGNKSIPTLERLGMKTAYDFVKFSRKEIEKRFSRPMVDLHKELGGENVLEVESDADPRDQHSIQSTSTFRPASTDPKIIWREISENAEHACENTRALRLVSNKISFFVKTSEFKYHFDEVKLGSFTSDPGIVLNAIESRFLKILPKRQRIRSTGVILHHLTREEKIPMDLFGKQEKAMKGTAVEEVADRIREKFGNDSILRAASLKIKK
ncbi:MAG TPA: DNA polymerase IV [Candidatus Paceibacterota bacterium]|nr:DNA polymerase IV [Candidatus Paceibacterota bacterium]